MPEVWNDDDELVDEDETGAPEMSLSEVRAADC